MVLWLRLLRYDWRLLTEWAAASTPLRQAMERHVLNDMPQRKESSWLATERADAHSVKFLVSPELLFHNWIELCVTIALPLCCVFLACSCYW